MEHPVIQDGREFDHFLARLVTKGLIASLLVTIVAGILMFQEGGSTRSIILLGGALLSPLAIAGWVWMVIIKAMSGGPKPGVVPMLVAFSGFIPYTFGCYLVFYEGLWGFVRLFDAFTFGSLLAKIFYLVAGYVIVLAIFRISEFGRALTEGRIEIKKGAI